MRDVLMLARETPLVRQVVKALGIPTPTPLLRAQGAWPAQPLAGDVVVLGGGGFARWDVEAALKHAGARLMTPEELPVDARAAALVLDVSSFASPADLDGLYNFFQPLLSRVAGNGRILVLAGAPATARDVAQATTRRAVEGFVRSLAKELGRRGTTVNLLYVEDGAQARLHHPLLFLLSRASAFVDGQALTVTARAAAPGEVPTWQLLKGKVVLVTGAARGIGAATAERLALEGAHVVCLDVPGDLEALNATAQRVGGTALPLDLRAPVTAESLVAFVREKWGGVDGVVHNAGVTRDKTLARMSQEQWKTVLDINLQAILRVDEALLNAGALRPHARVVCLSSIGGIAGNPGQTNYGATKAGLLGYVAAQSTRHAAQGITFNAVAPGFIETRMTAAMPLMVREVGRRLNALSQGGLPEDVAQAITFLVSPGSHGLTGQVLRVCGQSFLGA